MATRKITDDADDAAGRRAGAKARRAAGRGGEAVDQAADATAKRVRRAARRSAQAYDATTDEVQGRAASLEDAIRENPLAAAGAALLIGVVLGRFVL